VVLEPDSEVPRLIDERLHACNDERVALAGAQIHRLRIPLAVRVGQARVAGEPP
jgi:hypothetical protein